VGTAIGCGIATAVQLAQVADALAARGHGDAARRLRASLAEQRR
jgi:hypothetical protein